MRLLMSEHFQCTGGPGDLRGLVILCPLSMPSPREEFRAFWLIVEHLYLRARRDS